MVLGILVLITSVIFLVGSGLLLVKQQALPIGGIIFGIVMALLGAGFGYVAVRLFVVGDNDNLFSSRAGDRTTRNAA